MGEGFYIYKKEVDWSVLQQGFTIPVSIQVVFKQLIKDSLLRGTTKKVKLLIDGQIYSASLVNQKFDINKYPNHKDIIQFRYEPNSIIAKKMQNIFSETFKYCLELKKNDDLGKNKKKPIFIPQEKKEYLMLYTTQFDDTFLLEYLTANDNEIIDNQMNLIDEEEFEMSINYQKEDDKARIEEKMQLVKVRKLDRSICENLKLLYDNRCQITGVNFCDNYNVSVVEAHHIDYFVKSQNNNSNNIVIISPNYHRLIHKLNPIFDRQNLAFVFPNGLSEKIKLNRHL